MKKIISLFTLVLLFSSVALAQTKQQIVYDLSDTVYYNSVLEKCVTILNESPDAELEIVCHENAIYMLVKETTSLEDKMNALKRKGSVHFKVCANTMKRFGVRETDLLSIAEMVPVAVLEISKKQADGWSYKRGSQININRWTTTDRTDFINSCIDEAKKGISEDKAKLYCNCMLSLIEGKYPEPADAVKISAADLESPEWKAAVKACLQ